MFAWIQTTFGLAELTRDIIKNMKGKMENIL